MSSIRQKFQPGDVVFNPDWGKSTWTVVASKPDATGRILVINRFDEYHLAYQADLEELK